MLICHASVPFPTIFEFDAYHFKPICWVVVGTPKVTFGTFNLTVIVGNEEINE